jgi:C4-dicarboxylate transporter DctQ subunit
MCFRFLQVMVSFIRTGELPHHDHGHVDGIEEMDVPLVEKRVEVRGVLDNDSTANGNNAVNGKEDAR